MNATRNTRFKLTKINLFKCCVVLMVSMLLGLTSQAKNYYISSSAGNDSYSSTQAQSQATPWKSLSKVNGVFNIMVAGDSILFKRGDVFYGSLVIKASGNSSKRIIVGAYGSGAKPLFSGFTKTSSWTSIGSGIWQCSVPAAKIGLNLITVDGKNQAIGRYPNADAANGGYLNYESFKGTSITDNQLPASPNWAGADVVIRKTRWILDICKINSHAGTTINYTNPATGSNYPGLAGFGYFIQNDPRTLDKFGEWYFNKQNKTMQMFFGAAAPSAYTINISSIDTVLNLDGYNYITLDNIALEGGNVFGLHVKNGNGITIQNCDLNNSGDYGFYIWNIQNLLVQNNTVNNVLNNGVYVNNRIVTTPTTIRNNTIKGTGALAGMGESGDNTYIAMGVFGDNYLLQYNTIDGSGYNGLQFLGNNIVVKNNFVTNFCTTKDDGGGIYTWGNDGNTQYFNRTISGNIVTNAIGAGYGTQRPNDSQDARGIYLDGGAMNIDITDNSIANCVGSGFYYNNIINIKSLRNTVFNAKSILSLQRYNLGPLLRNNIVKNNIFFPLYPTQNDIFYWNSKLNVPVVADIQTDMRQIAVFDSNYYRNDVVAPVDYFYHLTFGGTFVDPPPLNFVQWQAFINQDAHSKLMPKEIPKYTINRTISANTVQNGKFETNIAGLTIGSSNNNATAAWDNTSKITGTGTLKITPKSSTSVFTAFFAPVGAVVAGKSYILKITTRGTTINGYMSAALRQIGSPYANITPTQNKFFGSAIQTNEFLITPTVSESNTSYLIGIQQSSGVTYIDDIEFYQVDASPVAVESQVRFEYNATTLNKTVSLDANYLGVDGTSYSGSLTLAPYTSKILILNGASTGGTTPPPAQTLIATGTAPAINCFGGSTTATVTASGGTAPYSGTGSYSVNAGKGSLKISISTPAAGSKTLLYSNVGALSNTKSYVLRFSTLGTMANGSLVAAIRETNSPWANITPIQTRTFGTGRVDHEFLFNAPPTETAASFIIGLVQATGSVYIDNIAFFEATSAGVLISDNLYDGGQFESSISNIYTWSPSNNHVAALDLSGKIANTYYYPVTDANKSIATATVLTTQPATALLATATAGNVTVTGGTTTVVITATGGTAPYTGTGNFGNIKVGTYNYTVTDAKGCTSVASVTVRQNAVARIATNNTDTIASRPLISNSSPVQNSELSINSYPNPTTSEFSLMVAGGTNEMVNISVMSVDGRIAFKTQGTSNKRYTFGNNFVNGVYIVQVMQGKTIQTIKVVKNK